MTTPTYCLECPLRGRPCLGGRRVEGLAGEPLLLIVGEAPGATEAAFEKVFIGPSGQLLGEVLEEVGDVPPAWLTNAVACFPPAQEGSKDKSHLTAAASYCRERLDAEIAGLPSLRAVLALGNMAAVALCGRGPGITRRRGHWETYRTTDGRTLPVMLSVHPAYVLRQPPAYPDLREDVTTAIARVHTGRDTTVRVDDEETQRTREYTLVRTGEELARLQARCEGARYAVLDVETTGLRLHQDTITCAVVRAEGETFILPRDVLTSEGGRAFLRETRARWSGHNAKFDRNMLAADPQIGVVVDFSFDSMLAHYLLDERGGIHGLKQTAAARYGVPDWEAPLKEYLRAHRGQGYGDIPEKMLYPYAAQDGYWQDRLTGEVARELAAQDGLGKVFRTLLMPASRALANAELRGVVLNDAELNRLRPQYEVICNRIGQHLGRMVGHPLNPRSNPQVAAAMFDELGIPPVSGQGRSTNAKEVLEYRKEHPFVQALLRFREKDKVLGTYIKGLAKHVVPGQGTIHTSFNLHGTVTGRLSSDSPNLQNQPKKDKNIKALFMAREGHLFSYADFSQVEYRLLAWFTGDPFLLDVYRGGGDLHGEMARDLWGEDYQKEQRDIAKTLNFNLLYGGGVEGIANNGRYQLTLADAMALQRRFFERVTAVNPWKDEVWAQVMTQGYVRSPVGRRRRFPYVPAGVSREDLATRAALYREAVNFLPQSAASDATLLAFIRLDAAGFHPVITVHDSILCEVPEADAEEMHREQLRIMVQAAVDLYGDKVPFVAEGGVGRTWKEAES